MVQPRERALKDSMCELQSGNRCCCGFEGLKAFHRPALHLDRAMVLLNTFVEVVRRTHFDPAPRRMLAPQSPHCAVAGWPIKHHLQRTVPIVRR